MRIVISLFAWIGYVMVYLTLLPVTILTFLVTYPFDKHRLYANRLFMLAGRSFLWFNPLWEVHINGLDQYNKYQPTIFIANHQSFLDMPVMALLPWKMKWVSKDGLFKVPILGWYMKMSGHISVKRGTTAALKALNELKPYLADGVPVMLFPEGTRSRSGELLKFKSGAFMLSKELGVPVQPVLISGTRDVMKPDTWIAAPRGTMNVTLMKAHDPSDYLDVNAMRDDVYDEMLKELNKNSHR